MMLQDCMDKFIVVFVDDIQVYSKAFEKHDEHLRFTLQRLREKQLYANFSKCEFWLDQVVFLGHVVLDEGISVNLSMIKAVLDWQRSKIVKEVQSFMGLVRYYKRFVKGFGRATRLLTTLMKKET
ncbi:uncharacterized mitochondrial protein AtMg00860-like [Mangifera indica]|uniref:uncharacterized mitochondrial protein AtMg00860-like n=1 Tax=Mangifera indica TaxID=29780 RepID=UPI001CFA84D8|nr:uncharacterized mitochondrial protein AtMg00860-like [Mangifera indica]